MKNELANFYLEYLNDFLTIQRFAEYHDMTATEAGVLIALGRAYHEERTSK